MTKLTPRNVSASIRQRLLNLAKKHRKRYNDLLQHYAMERWLYRLSKSDYSGQFVLKGALMLSVWKVPINRPTRDIDLLAKTSNDLEAIGKMIAAICKTPVEDDGILFDHNAVITSKINEDADYSGVRATFHGHLGTARLPMQIDIGFGDIITPAPVEIAYPTVLDLPAPHLRAYNRETAIAEKFEAMVKIGELNSRMKDFFDIWALADAGDFDGLELQAAVQKTFERRATIMSTSAPCFSEHFSRNPRKDVQWKAFINRGELIDAPIDFNAAWLSVMLFLKPIGTAIETNSKFTMTWLPGGPWMARNR